MKSFFRLPSFDLFGTVGASRLSRRGHVWRRGARALCLAVCTFVVLGVAPPSPDAPFTRRAGEMGVSPMTVTGMRVPVDGVDGGGVPRATTPPDDEEPTARPYREPQSARTSAPVSASNRFTALGTSIDDLRDSAIAWGDYNNDGNPDLVLIGADGGGTPTTSAYRNDGGSFTSVSLGLPDLRDGDVVWGDYNGDGNEDLAIAGSDGLGEVTEVHTNGGGSFSSVESLTGVQFGAVLAWGDVYPSDGSNLDLFVAGRNQSSGRIGTQYGYNVSAFQEVSNGITAVERASGDWGDYDNDGNRELVVTGDDGNSATAVIYENSGSQITNTVGAGLDPVTDGSSEWGDYNGDGNLDLVITGSGTATIYKNNGGSFTKLTSQLTGVTNSSSDWGDYDGDGDLDLVVTGNDGSGASTTIYRNDGGDTFTPINAGLAGVVSGDSEWADIDGDGDLDLAVSGEDGSGNPTTYIYENNPPPSLSTSGLSVSEGGSTVLSSTNLSASDDKSGASTLTYTVETAPSNGELYNTNMASTVGTGTFTQADINNGVIEYRHDGSETTSDAIDLHVEDGEGATSSTKTLSISVNSVNDAPTASGDSYSTDEDQTLSVGTPGLLGNDSDPDDSPSVNTTPVSGPSNGSVTLNSDGSFDYTPNTNYNGSDSFTYEITDGSKTDQATVSITVNAVNDAPTIATNNTLTLDEGTNADITQSLLETTDVESGPSNLVYSVDTAPSNGTIYDTNAGSSVSSFTQADLNNNSIEYRHDDSETTSDSFDFTVTDQGGSGKSVSGTFNVDVTPVDDTPPQDPSSTNGATISAANAASYSVDVTFSSAPESGTVTARLSDGSTTVTGTAPANTGGTTTTVTGIDATSLADGSVTIDAKIVDDAGNTNSSGFTAQSTVSKDTGAPSISNVNLGNDGNGNLSLSFESSESLGALTVTVDGPSSNDVYSFSLGDFSESGSGPYTYTLSTTQAYSNGDGTYTAVVDVAEDGAGNDGANGESDSYTLDTTGPTTAPSLTATAVAGGDVALTIGDVDDGTNTYSLRRSTTSGGSYSEITTLSDDNSASYSYTDTGLNDGTTYYYVVVPIDGSGNEGATSSEASATADATAPTVNSITASNPSGQDVQIAVETDEALGGGSGDLEVGLSGAESATLTRSSFAESGSGPYTYTVTYVGSSDGTYTATLNAAKDPAGNDGASGESASVNVDTTPPQDPTSTSGTPITTSNDDSYSVDVTFSSAPESGTVTARLSDGSTTVTGTAPANTGGTTTTVTGIDATSLADGSVTIDAKIVDDAGNTNPSGFTAQITVTKDVTAPTISNVSLGDNGSGELDLSFESDERLGGAVTALAVTVDGPTTTDAYTFNREDFSESGSGPYTYSLTTTQAYDDGGGTYTATVDDAQDVLGNSASPGQSDSYTFDPSAPAISNVSLGNDGSDNLTLRFESDEALGATASDLTVSVDGPSTIDVYTFDRNDFSESGSGPYTYTLSTTQAYTDGDGTYTAVVDVAKDAAGNDGASAESDSYVLDTTPPTISSIADQTISEDGTTGALSVTIGDNVTSAADLTLSVGTNDPSLVPGDSLVLGGSGTDRTVEAVPVADSNGTAQVTVTVTDAAGNAATEPFALTVEAVNDTPRVVTNAGRVVAEGADSLITDAHLEVQDVESAPSELAYTLASVPVHGTLYDTGTGTALPRGGTFTQATLNGGTLAYRHDGSETMADSFAVVAADPVGAETDTTTVTVTVEPVNDRPRAAADTARTDEDTDVTIPVLANDVDAEGRLDTASVAVADAPSAGTASADAPTGRITYAPAPDSNGTDRFTYVVSDAAGATDTATVRLEVRPVNDPPVARPDTAVVVEGDTVSVPVLTNDTDVEGRLDTASVTVERAPTNGTVTDVTDGTVTYAPDPGYSGLDSLTYTVSDPDGATAQPAPVLFDAQDVALAASADTHRVGSVQVGLPGDTVTVEVENAGETPLTNLTAELAGPAAGDFSVLSVEGGRLSPTERRAVRVAFVPTAPGVRSAALSVRSAEGGVAQTTLVGRGVSIALTTGDAARGQVGVGVEGRIEGGFVPSTRTALYVRDGGAARYRAVDSFGVEGADDRPVRLRGRIEDTLTTRGVDYYAVLSDGRDTLTVPAGGPGRAAARPRHLSVSFEQWRAPVAFAPETYQMVSVPARPDGGVKAALEAVYGAYDPAEWRALRWDPASDAYREYTAIDSLRPGQALWLITAGGDSLSLRGGQTVDASTPQLIPLRPGWNQVGNPFGFAVPWDSVRGASGLDGAAVDGPVAYRDGAYRPGQETLAPWRGYFVFNATGERDTLVIPPVGGSDAETETAAGPKALAKGASSEDGAYTVRLTARTRDGGPRRVWMGLRPRAKRGRDALDFAQAPHIGSSVRVSVQESVGGRTVPHAGSFKPPADAGQAWTVVLAAPADREAATEVRLDFRGEGPLPAGQRRYVLDLGGERRVTPGASLTLAPGERRRLRVIVGTEAYAKQHSEGVGLSSYETALRGNYPNPFGRETTLAYTLGREQTVTIEVYNVLGQRVRILVREKTQKAGLHRIQWRGENRYGDPVGSGVYFVRMRAKDFTATRKLVLVR